MHVYAYMSILYLDKFVELHYGGTSTQTELPPSLRQPLSQKVTALQNPDVPVFDRRREQSPIVDEMTDLQPTRTRIKGGGIRIQLPGDPIKPIATSAAPDIEQFAAAGKAWYSSHFFSDQASNDNKDWPLEKLLNTEHTSIACALPVATACFTTPRRGQRRWLEPMLQKMSTWSTTRIVRASLRK